MGGFGTLAPLPDANLDLRTSYALPFTLPVVCIIGFSYLNTSRSKFLIVKATGTGLSSKLEISWGIFEFLARADISLRFVGSLVMSDMFGFIFEITWVLFVMSLLLGNNPCSWIELDGCSVLVILTRFRYGLTSYLCFTGVKGGNNLRVESSEGGSILFYSDSWGADMSLK